MALTTSTRIGLCVAILITGFLEYVQATISYTVDLQHPMFLVYAFTGSLLLAIGQQLWSEHDSHKLQKITVLVMYFLIGVLFAGVIRGFYVDFTTQIIAIPDVQSILGSDYYSAITNKTVGYGGCFGLGLLLARLTTYRWLTILVFKLSLNKHPDSFKCPHCHNL